MTKIKYQQCIDTNRNFFNNLLIGSDQEVVIFSNEQRNLVFDMEGRQKLKEEVFKNRNINTFYIKININLSSGILKTYDCILNCSINNKNTQFFFYNQSFNNNNNTKYVNYESRPYIGLKINSNTTFYNNYLEMPIYKNNYGLIDYLLEQKNNELIHYFAVNVLRILKSSKPLEPNYDSKNELLYWTSVHVAFLILTSERLRSAKCLVISYIEFYKLKNEKDYSKLENILKKMFHPINPSLFFPKKNINNNNFLNQIKFINVKINEKTGETYVDGIFYTKNELIGGGTQFIKSIENSIFYDALKSIIYKSPVYNVFEKWPNYLQDYLREKFIEGKLYKLEAIIKNMEKPRVPKIKFKFLVNKFKNYFDLRKKVILKKMILIIKRRKEEKIRLLVEEKARLLAEEKARIALKEAEKEAKMLAQEIARLAKIEEESKLFAMKETKHAEKRIRRAEKEILLSNERIRDYENEIIIAEKEIMSVDEELKLITNSKIKRLKKTKINLNSVPLSFTRNHCLNKSSKMIYPNICSTNNYVTFTSAIPFGFDQFSYQTQFFGNSQFSNFYTCQIPILNQYQHDIQQYQMLQRKPRKRRIKSKH